jgi:hypothetical protein
MSYTNEEIIILEGALQKTTGYTNEEINLLERFEAENPDAIASQQQKEEKEGTANGQTAWETTQEVGAEIALSAVGQGLALASGIGYIPVAFGTGYAASVTAQGMYGDDDVSQGRAIVNGFVNLIFGSQWMRGLAGGGKVTSELIKQAAKEEGKRGAAIGIGEASAVALIDENRLPTPEELLTYGVGGAAFGGALGAASPKIAQSFKKFLGKNADEIDEDIASGKITEQEAVDFVGPTQPKPTVRRVVDETISAADSKRAEKVILQTLEGDEPTMLQRLTAKIVPSRVTGREVQDETFMARSKINSAIELGSRIERNVAAAIAINPKLKPLVNKFLETGIIDKQIKGSKLAGDLQRFDETRFDLQDKLVRQLEGVNFESRNFEESQKLLAAIKDSMRDKNYVTREYRAFTDSKFKFDLNKRADVVNEIADKIQLKNPNLTRAQVKEQASEHLQKLQDHSAAAKKLNPRTHIPATTDGILRFRHDVGPLERAFLGEITDSGERMRGTLTGLAKTVYRNESDANVANALQRLGLALREVDVPNKNAFVKLDLKGEMDNNLYVPRNVQAALGQTYLARMDELSNDVVKGAVMDAYSTAVGLSKAAKVLFNPPSYAVNAYGGLITMIGSGINPFTNGYGKGMKYALAEFGNIEDLLSRGGADARKALLTDMQEMTKYGLSKANILESDIRDAFNQGGIGQAIGKKLNPVGRAYAVTDTAARYAVWVGNQRALSKIYPNLKGEDLKLAAAKLTNDTFQNYDKLSPIIRQLSRMGVMPQFVSFTAEFMRNIYNQTRYAKQMIAGNFGQELGLAPSTANVAAMRKEGAKRLTALVSVVAATEALRRGMNAENGITSPEQEQALRDTALAEYDKRKSIMFTEISEDGKTGKYINMSYLSPHAMIAEAINAAATDQPLDSLADMLVENFVGEGNFVISSVYDAVENMDENGESITEETGRLAKFKDQLKYIVTDTFKTGAQREVEKVLETINTKDDEDPRYSFGDIAKRQLGYRITSFDVARSARFKMRSHKESANLAAQAYNRARDNDNLSPQALEEVYQNANRIRKDNLDLAAKNDRDLQQLNFTEEERIKVMKEAGISSKDIVATLEGSYNPIPRQKTLSTAEILEEEEFKDLSIRDTFTRIRAITEDNMPLRKRLLTEYKRKLVNERRGVSSKDDLIKNMSTAERADYIQANPSRLQEFRRKGIVTKSVVIELRRRGFEF